MMDGVTVQIRTAQGHHVPVRAGYYHCEAQRQAGKRYQGVYADLIVLGIYDRCTPALAAEVSLLTAMAGSLDEAQAVLSDRGIELDAKTVRLIAYRSGARLEQQLETTTWLAIEWWSAAMRGPFGWERPSVVPGRKRGVVATRGRGKSPRG